MPSFYSHGKLTPAARSHFLALQQREASKSRVRVSHNTLKTSASASDVLTHDSNGNGKYQSNHDSTLIGKEQSGEGSRQGQKNLDSKNAPHENHANQNHPNQNHPVEGNTVEDNRDEENTRISIKHKTNKATNDWAAIISYNNAAIAAEEALQKQLVEQGKIALRTDLDKQKQQAQILKWGELEEKKRALEATKIEVEKFKAEEQRKKAEIAKHLAKEKEVREKQIKEGQLRREREALKEKREEAENVRKIKQDLALERERVAKLREEQAAAMKLIITENDRERKLKLELAQRERDEAVRLQKEYIELMEKQARQREESLKELLNRQAQSQAMYAATVGSSLAQQMAEDERRAEEMQKEFNSLRLEKERLEKIKHQKKLDETKQKLKEQLEFREGQKRKEKEDEMRYAEQIRLQSIKAKQEQEDALKNWREKQNSQKKDLEKQISEIHSRRESEGVAMTDAERKMNAKLLASVDTNPVPKVNELALQKTPFPWKVIERRAPF